MSLSLIIKREFIAKVRNKSFIVMTFLSPILIVAMAALIGYLVSVNNDEEVKVAVYDQFKQLSGDLKSDAKTKYTDLSAMPFDKAREVASKDYAGLIYVPELKDITELKSKVQYISADSPNMDFVSGLEGVIGDKVTRANLKALNFDYDKIEKAQAEATVKLSKFDGEETNKKATLIRIIIGAGSGYLIMMFVIIYGNMVMRSVIEEKTNRIIEIIVSSVKPFKLMMGKIVGTSLAGVLQFTIWCVLGIALFMVLGLFLGMQMGGAAGQVQAQAAQEGAEGIQVIFTELSKLPLLSIMISFLVYFIGGFFLYSSLYAAIGAAVDSETDSQQFLLPIIMPLMLAVYVGFFSVVTDPHGTVAVIFSYIPLTSPIVMMMRIPFGVSIWEVLASLTILYATFFGVVWFAAKIYRIGILMYGKKPTYKEIFKWLKY
ncbi:ABC transporter permease [Flavobacterium akiainvivens]|uniref:ABC transporter permease n=1 Tax=Flavobacterium akiainvivens TaxID=1202724 RepID=A0A0M8MFN2_9FLAO|nr:ABC transporter permease [Flavobacterium akiainvivens]KOS04628.1 ABC transporter permease [Flavobacterium akiainvivens]SFQ65702.1 ABC-2 type transport system permease protein [Flavobacterium akiainvivens]